MNSESLIEAARSAKEMAYAPYSHFRVGAALLTAQGKIYKGCNIENSAFSPTNCAERTAFFKAVSEGERHFTAIAIVSDKDEACPPCGVCRQVMSEFCDYYEFKIILGKKHGYEEYRLSDLLPCAFSDYK